MAYDQAIKGFLSDLLSEDNIFILHFWHHVVTCTLQSRDLDEEIYLCAPQMQGYVDRFKLLASDSQGYILFEVMDTIVPLGRAAYKKLWKEGKA